MRDRAGWTFRAGPGTQLTHVAGLPLGTRGGILAKVDLPSDGEYQVDVADMVTHIWGNGMEFENPLVVTLDNKLVYETVIGGEEDMKLYDQVQNGALDRVNARLKKIRFFATAGPHRIGVTFKRRTFAESDDQLQMFTPGGGQDRLYRVSSFQLQGPFDAKGLSRDAEPRAHLHLHSPRARLPTRRRRCAKQIITSLAKRAYRRPVSAEDVNELLAVLPGRRERRRLRGRHPQRDHRSSGEPVLPVSRRARARLACAPARPTPSAISSSRRSCRSSSGTRSRTTSCCKLAIDGKLSERRGARPAGASACSPIRVP